MLKEKQIKWIVYNAIFSLIWTCVSCYLSIYLFDKNLIFTKKHIVYLILLFFCIFAGLHKAAKLYNQIKMKDERGILFLKYFAVIFCVYAFFLILTWPGIWRWDEFWILDSAKYLSFNAYQNYITSIMYILSLMLIPFPTGVVIIQIFLCAYMATEICLMVNYEAKIKRSFRWIIFIPFFLQPAIGSVLYPIRCSMFAFLELYLYIYVFFRVIQPKKLTVYSLIKILVITVILSAWRAETFFYMLVIPLIIWFCFRNKKYNKMFFLMTLLCLLFGSAMIKIQSSIEKETFGEQYKLISMLRFIEAEDKKNKFDDETLSNIEKVISMETLRNEGAGAIWDNNSGLLKDYSENDFRDLQVEYAKMVVFNLSDFIVQQTNVMRTANGLGKGFSSPFVEKSYDLYTEEKLNGAQGKTIQDIFLSEKFTKPLNEEVRSNTIKFLQGVSIRREKNVWLFPFIYNSIPAMLLLIIVLLKNIKTSEKFWSLIAIVVLLKTLAVIAAAPGSSFMYYFPTWLVGYVLFIASTKTIRCEAEMEE